ncbi:hypothetical protein BH23CHL5_BH23CHL5_24390 [soil metagenome]
MGEIGFTVRIGSFTLRGERFAWHTRDAGLRVGLPTCSSEEEQSDE